MQIQKLLKFFSKNISIYAIFNDQNFNDTLLTNNIVNFEQLGPEIFSYFYMKTYVLGSLAEALLMNTTSIFEKKKRKISANTSYLELCNCI